MASTFFQRIDQLADHVGRGTLRGKVVVDQVYAHYQHERAELRHPRGGQPFYLSQPWMAGAFATVERLGKTLLDVGGETPKDAMRTVVEDGIREVHERAPREFDDLRDSASGEVTDDGREVFNRPALVHRLTDAELREKDRLRAAGHRSYPLDHPQHRANRRRP
jgi:hypothetical protein